MWYFQRFSLHDINSCTVVLGGLCGRVHGLVHGPIRKFLTGNCKEWKKSYFYGNGRPLPPSPLHVWTPLGFSSIFLMSSLHTALHHSQETSHTPILHSIKPNYGYHLQSNNKILSTLNKGQAIRHPVHGIITTPTITIPLAKKDT